MNHSKILHNRATRTHDAPKELLCSACDEALVFAMRDKYHSFSLGLLTVLECLNQAEERGDVPALPNAWWSDICN